jgi:hypothetical protein
MTVFKFIEEQLQYTSNYPYAYYSVCRLYLHEIFLCELVHIWTRHSASFCTVLFAFEGGGEAELILGGSTEGMVSLLYGQLQWQGGEVSSSCHGGEVGGCYRYLILERLINKKPST